MRVFPTYTLLGWQWSPDNGQTWQNYPREVSDEIKDDEDDAGVRYIDPITGREYIIYKKFELNPHTGEKRKVQQDPSGSIKYQSSPSASSSVVTMSSSTVVASSSTAAKNSKSLSSASTLAKKPKSSSAAVVSSSSPSSVWQCFVDGVWTNYDTHVQQALDQLHSGNGAGHPITLKLGAQNYNIDIHNYQQQNSSTEYMRAIRNRMEFKRIDVVDWGTVVKMTRVYSDSKAPVAPLCKKKYEPATYAHGDWEQLGDGNDDEPVVELSCSTPSGTPCIFRRKYIVQFLDASPKCPNCGHLYQISGTQPPGMLDIFSTSSSWITGVFHFPSGFQGPRQENPRKPYRGRNQKIYYPNTTDGREAIRLVKKTFMRGSLFTIGTSVTTGCKNMVVFGGIHLKTAITGGPTNHGYPDNTWFARLKGECASRNIS